MAILKQGNTILNAGAKGDKGDAGTSPSVRVVTNQTELTTVLSGVEKELSIQADFTLSSDVTIPDGAILSDGGGVLTCGANTITFVNNSFKSNYDRTFIDLGQSGVIDDASTFSNGDINIVWFGLVDDGVLAVKDNGVSTVVQSGTDNRNIFLQCQKIWNYTGGAATIKGSGKYAFSVVEPINFQPPTNLYFTGKASLTMDANVKLLVLPNALENYKFITFVDSKGGFIKGGEIYGDEFDHTYASENNTNDSAGCHGIYIDDKSEDVGLYTSVFRFSGDLALEQVNMTAVYSSAGSGHGVDETRFLATGGAKGYIIDSDGTKTINADYNYTEFLSLSSASFASYGNMLIGGNYANGGVGGMSTNTMYIAYYSDVIDGITGEYTFIERTGLVDHFQPLPLKTEYKYFRVIITTPLDWAVLNLSVFGENSPKRTIYGMPKLEWGVRQSISNVSSSALISGINFDYGGLRSDRNLTGSPAYFIDVEDGYQALQNMVVQNNIFGNVARGIIILKGTKFLKFIDNDIQYPTDPNFVGRTCNFENGHETDISRNKFRLNNVSIGRRDKLTNNLFFDCEISVRLENEEVSNNIGFNTTHFITSVYTGTEVSYYKNNTWHYDKPLSDVIGNSVITFNGNEKRIFENETYDFHGNTHRYTVHNLFKVDGSSSVATGYIDGFIIKNTSPDIGYESSQTASFPNMNINRLVSSTNVQIQYGGVADRIFKNSTINGFLDIALSSYPTINTGTFTTYTLKDTDINIVDSARLNSVNALTVGTKDVNFVMRGGSINIKIGTHTNADNFLSLTNYGTKKFYGVTFYTDHTTPQVQALDASYEFINCTFNNITFTNATITTTTSGADGLSAYEVAVADGFVGDETAWLASLVGADGATGATGSATGAMNLGFIQYETFKESGTTQGKAVIDVINETIDIEAYSVSILKNGTSSGDKLRLKTPTTTQSLDFSGFLTSNVVVYLIWNDGTGLFEIGSSLADFTSSADHFFITSFRRFTGQTDVKLSFNQHGFRILSSSPEYITKWTILGDSHTVGGLWMNEAERLHGKINEYLPLGVSGSTVADILANSFYDRRTQITTDTDLLTIFGGTNDYEQSATVGTVQDGGTYTVTTTIGSLQEIIEYAYSQNPAIKINLITPVYHLDANTGGVQYDVSAYTDAFQAVGDYYNIPVLHLNSEMGINKYNYAEWMNTGETKPIHFNDYGREKVGRIVTEFIKANY